MFSSRSAIVAATVAAIAFTSFDLRPAAAAPQAGSAIAKNSGADELSGARKRRRGGHPGVPIAAFGAIVGTIAGIAAAERRREIYEQPYGYYGAGPGYYEAPVAAAPYAYGPQYGYQHQGYRHGGYGGGSGHGGYRGPGPANSIDAIAGTP